MNDALHPLPLWATAADGDATDTSPMELMLLGEHLVGCRGDAGRWMGLRCAAEQVHGFAAPRLITTLVAATAVMAAAALVF
jgi:hypothetical protein